MVETNLVPGAKAPLPRNLSMDVVLMILERLSQHDLAQKARDFDVAVVEAIRKTTEKIMEETEQKAKQPGSAEARNKYKERLEESVSEKAKDKARGDPLYNALLDKLVAKSNRTYQNINEMMDILSCQNVIPRLKEVSLATFLTENIAMLQKIRTLNPDMKWNIYVNQQILEQIGASETLDGLNGSIHIHVSDQNSLRLLENICEKAHPDLRLGLSITVDELPLQQLQQYTIILSRLMKLSISCDTFRRNGMGNEISALENICQNYEFDLDMTGAGFQFLNTSTDIPKRLVALSLLFPENNEAGHINGYGRQNVLRKLELRINDMQPIGNYTQFRCPLTYLEIKTPLQNKSDISSFALIRRDNPHVQFHISLEHKDLLQYFVHTFQNSITLCFGYPPLTMASNTDIADGFKLECEVCVLGHLSYLNLKSVRDLRLLLSNRYVVDRAFIITILNECPNIENLAIQRSSSYARLHDIPEVLQQTLSDICPNMARLETDNRDDFARISLPDFVQEKLPDTILWHKVRK